MEKKGQDQNLLESIAESFSKLSGSLTGKNIEEKLIEYSEVYGEILLNLHRSIEELKKENKFLKKEISKLETQIKNIQVNPRKENNNKFFFVVGITLFNLALLIFNIILLL
ncbi:MAG: hypothetical protein ACK4UJ_01855 [Leptonema sp. (in: bacteria)]